jgi:hypothetical protein
MESFIKNRCQANSFDRYDAIDRPMPELFIKFEFLRLGVYKQYTDLKGYVNHKQKQIN